MWQNLQVFDEVHVLSRLMFYRIFTFIVQPGNCVFWLNSVIILRRVTANLLLGGPSISSS